MDATSGRVNETTKQNSTAAVQMVESPGSQGLRWVAFQQRGDQYLYKENFEGNTCQVVEALNEWYKVRVRAWNRLVLRWLLCQRVAVYIGTLDPVDPSITVTYPHKTRFKTLRRSDLLSDSFQYPDTLVDAASFLSTDPSFRANEPTANARAHPGCDRSVMLLKHELDKKLLALPLSIVTVATLAASIAVGIIAHSVEAAASVFGGVLGITTVLVAYLTWLLK